MELLETDASVELRYAPPGGVGKSDEVITVRFHCQDTADMPEDLPRSAIDSMVGAPVDFNVLVEWESLDRTLSFDCQGWNDSLTIRAVAVYDHTTAEDEATYSGPVFDDLDDSVKDGFYDFLDERLVSPEFGTWVTRFAYFKELDCYGKWLDKVRSLL